MSATSWKDWDRKAFKSRNRPLLKLNRSQLEEAVQGYDRILAISTDIRRRAGLPPIEDGPTIKAARIKLAEAPVKSRRAKKVLAPRDMVADLAKRRRKAEKERETVDKAIAELVRDKILPVSVVAAELGVSRQRVYQLAD